MLKLVVLLIIFHGTISLDDDEAIGKITHYVENGCICPVDPYITKCYNDKTENCKNFPKNINVTTPALEIASTHIKTIKYGDLENLSHLQILFFHGNSKLKSIEPHTFENMSELISLQFYHNQALKAFDPDTFQGLVHLKNMNLSRNGFWDIDGLLKSLSSELLPDLLVLTLSEQKFRNIGEHTFEPMMGSRLQELIITSCRIRTIHPKTLTPLKKLRALRLGQNAFPIQILNDLLNETINVGINLELLDLTSMGLRNNVSLDLLSIIANSNISELVLADNYFDVLLPTFFSIPLPNLRGLDISSVSLRSVSISAFRNLPNLNSLILSSNRLTTFPPGEKLLYLRLLTLADNIDTYGWQFNLHMSQFTRMKSLEDLNLKCTKLLTLTRESFGNITSLRTLNLVDSGIIFIAEDTFDGLANLRYLNLENNRLYDAAPNFHISRFRSLENLEVFQLGGNDLRSLKELSNDIFVHLKKLKHLGLHNNKIQSISLQDFISFDNLESLDISYNYLNSWDSRVFKNNTLKVFNARGNNMEYLSDAMIEDFQCVTKLDLGYNPLMCDCRMVDNFKTIKTILNATKDAWCVQTSNITLNYFFEHIEYYSSEMNCYISHQMVEFVVLGIMLLVLLIFGILGYVYRWEIRYKIFLIKFRVMEKKASGIILKDSYTNYQYDVFVSYCSQDQDFVLKLIKNLENAEPSLKLCIYERDFEIGTMISESVLENIAKSRKTLLVVSNAYVKSYWCTWESHIAKHHKLYTQDVDCRQQNNSIVLIKLEAINDTHLTPTLKNLLKTNLFLQWDTPDIKQKIFWMKLREHLSAPKNEGSSENNTSC